MGLNGRPDGGWPRSCVELFPQRLLRVIEMACWVYLSPAKKSFSGSSEGTRDWISE